MKTKIKPEICRAVSLEVLGERSNEREAIVVRQREGYTFRYLKDNIWFSGRISSEKDTVFVWLRTEHGKEIYRVWKQPGDWGIDYYVSYLLDNLEKDALNH